jgi:hypothetical protein
MVHKAGQNAREIEHADAGSAPLTGASSAQALLRVEAAR